MPEDWPSTQTMLLDHLRRIVEGVTQSPGLRGEDHWHFGFGADSLESPTTELDPEKQREASEEARFQLMLKLLGLEAQDSLGIPENWRRFREVFDGRALPDVSHFIDKALPEDADLEAIQRAVAYDLLRRLGDMAKRCRTALRERHLISKIPEPVDNYMAEAARCYRLGLDIASMVMCRSAVEEALKDHLGARGKTRKGFWKRFEQLIEDATCAGILNKGQADVADEIRKHGNDAVHGKPAGERALKKLASVTLVKARSLVASLYH